MATHFWLLPWFSLAAGLAAVLLGGIGTGFARAVAPRPATPRSLWFLWMLVAAAATLGSVRLGAAAGVDVVAARGLLLGVLGGVLLVTLCRSAWGTPALPPMLFGLGTALVAAGRLWLTHGEISGLTSVALGAALSVLCLGIAPSLLSSDAGNTDEDVAYGSALALLYIVSLAATAALGFTRAGALKEMFWADIPLLLGAGLSLGASVRAGLARQTRLGAHGLPAPAAALIVVLPLSRMVHSWRPAELVGMGVLLFGLLALLTARPSLASAPEEEIPVASSDLLGSLVGFVLIVAGCALAFALGSGYGLGLFLLGGWFAGGALLPRDRPPEGALEATANGLAAASALSFAALLLVYRLAILQSSPAVRASGPSDIWDLFAICLGALLPLIAAEWVRLDGLSARLPGWAVVLQWLLSLAAPALILDYIWQPRSVAGILLGAALGQLLAGLAGDARRRFAALAISSIILCLILFQFLPVLQQVHAAARHLRAGLVLGCALLLLLRLLVPGRPVSRAS